MLFFIVFLVLESGFAQPQESTKKQKKHFIIFCFS